jgi:hypothetical protein
LVELQLCTGRPRKKKRSHDATILANLCINKSQSSSLAGRSEFIQRRTVGRLLADMYDALRKVSELLDLTCEARKRPPNAPTD